ncbi:SRPBCC family protein [Haloarchaeobius amylolyticus]|uniref:SRPBCC family protein n=1 Tax=Haloarchaeobius amylolyticus TaxID=1198296 RepID=UPI002270606A|nr:SRPBCC family protein [Haloarchaeobius amylolyticus]
MPTYRRETVVRAPFEDVWEFHSKVSGLEALTPDWMHLRVESVTGPDGDPDPGILEPGAEIDMSMRPLNVGPRQRWTSVITEREEDDGAAFFRDEMRGGPFRKWVHTHSFYATDGGTKVEDRVEYRLPLGGLGDIAGPLAWVGFEPMFRARHRATKKLLES